ncbi:MAG: hypothetical protein M3Q95_12285 [Bacteroidota bacterium]|nr:hypothetical protein [Bacteroidota bacterium]
MLQNEFNPVYFVSGYVLLYCILLQFEGAFHYAFIMLLFSPILIFWMTYIVLRYGNYNDKNLCNKKSWFQNRTGKEHEDR